MLEKFGFTGETCFADIASEFNVFFWFFLLKFFKFFLFSFWKFANVDIPIFSLVKFGLIGLDSGFFRF